MDLEIILLSEVHQTEREKYHISLICGIWKIYKSTYLQNRNRPIEIENKLMLTKGEEE